MVDVAHRFVETNGIRMHVAERGEGPLVLLLHGWPESWYSWRHQIAALADAGYHVVAPDQRGYGQTDKPERIDDYTIHHLVGDVVGLIHALGESSAVVVGHDWGAPVAWQTALMRPDLVRGVVGLSVPYTPRGSTAPLESIRAQTGDGFYQIYFQEPGVAEKEFEADVDATLRMVLYGGANPVVPAGGGFLRKADVPPQLPDWLTEDDIAFYVGEFSRTGFTGGLNWYRNIDRNWALTGAWKGAVVQPPALYCAGDKDVVVAFPGMKNVIDNLQLFVPNLRETLVFDGCGHWTQQERAREVNAALLRFLAGL
jgi:pimeloyl-ACP methyl ester carboxylesterase